MIDLETKSSDKRSALPRVELEILRGRAKNRLRRIDVPVFLIGSAHDCDLVLADPDFPEVHTYVYVTKDGVSVRRLGEGPEMVVDGEVVQSSAMLHGQRLKLGPYEFTLHVEATHPAPTKGPLPTTSLPTAMPALALQFDLPGMAEVRCLLADIRSTLQIESGLKLYIEPETTGRITNVSPGITTRKATA